MECVVVFIHLARITRFSRFKVEWDRVLQRPIADCCVADQIILIPVLISLTEVGYEVISEASRTSSEKQKGLTVWYLPSLPPLLTERGLCVHRCGPTFFLCQTVEVWITFFWNILCKVKYQNIFVLSQNIQKTIVHITTYIARHNYLHVKRRGAILLKRRNKALLVNHCACNMTDVSLQRGSHSLRRTL